MVFLAHIIDGRPDWEPFYNCYRSSQLWRICGFETRPSYQTVYERFKELEADRYVSAFADLAGVFVKIAKHHEPRTGQHVHVDGTAAWANASLEHACPDPAACRALGERRPPKRAPRASDATVQKDRHRASAAPEPADPRAKPDASLTKLSDAEAEAHGLPDTGECRWYLQGGHYLRCRDRTAGARAYIGEGRRSRFWVGGYFMPAVCSFWGAPVAVHCFPADENEASGWPELILKTKRSLGAAPVSATFDRAFAIRSVMALNTSEGIATVVPDRKLSNGQPLSHLRSERYDEHGPRCRYCGGPGQTRDASGRVGVGLGFVVNGAGDPRLRYSCALGITAECATKIQTISCSRESRLLLPMSRLDARFHTLLKVQKNKESVFDNWRDRYAVAGNSQASRSKRTDSLAAQKLRANAALVAEWFRILLRHGMVGAHPRRNTEQPRLRTGGEEQAAQLLRYREREALDLPYGPAAHRLGLAADPGVPVPGSGAQLRFEEALNRPPDPGPDPPA